MIVPSESVVEQAPLLEEEAAGAPAELPPVDKVVTRSRKGMIVTIVLLGVALLTAVGFLAFYLLELDAANTRIADQDGQIEEQRILIEKKETFGAAMHDLVDAASEFDGVLVSSVVPFEQYERLAYRAWNKRWEPAALDRETASARLATEYLEELLSTASTEAATNSTGSKYEAVIDSLGSGFVTSVIDDADTLCESDVLACVVSDSPREVHFDAADTSLPYMTDWIRTGLAYHEFAHVLQFTNPEPTEIALESFGGDVETMADCFALTYLDGWTLDHRVWDGPFYYWDVSIGYGYTCNATQRQAIRDWRESLGFSMRPIDQEL